MTKKSELRRRAGNDAHFAKMWFNKWREGNDGIDGLHADVALAEATIEIRNGQLAEATAELGAALAHVDRVEVSHANTLERLRMAEADTDATRTLLDRVTETGNALADALEAADAQINEQAALLAQGAEIATLATDMLDTLSAELDEADALLSDAEGSAKYWAEQSELTDRENAALAGELEVVTRERDNALLTAAAVND